MFDVFVAASVRLGCARVSRQHRLGGSEWRLLKEYPVEWITVHVSRGTRMINSVYRCVLKTRHFRTNPSRGFLFRFVLFCYFYEATPLWLFAHRELGFEG